MTRTPAQFAADRRRSHKAKAIKNQQTASRMFGIRRMLANTYHDAAVRDYSEALATTARMARSHLNFLLSGTYADFV